MFTGNLRVLVIAEDLGKEISDDDDGISLVEIAISRRRENWLKALQSSDKALFRFLWDICQRANLSSLFIFFCSVSFAARPSLARVRQSQHLQLVSI